MTPAVSIVMPVFNGAATLERAINSVRAQTMQNWELLAADDGSTDQSLAVLARWSEIDPRIQVLKSTQNLGSGGARNVALKHASAPQIAYLDCDDEYFPDYLECVVRHQGEADVLVFRYDVLNVDGSIGNWDPERHRTELFLRNICTPLAVSHRRELAARVGGFDERLWFEVDWEYWKRLARGGAEFAFLPFKSGRYHARVTSQSRTRRLTIQQRENIERNRAAGKPIFWTERKSARPVKKILFAATQCLLDSASGAAVATRQMVDTLRLAGFDCRAYCGSQFDAAEEVALDAVLNESAGTCVIDTANASSLPDLAAKLTVFRSGSTRRGQMQPDEAKAFLRSYQRLLDVQRPDAVITYGGDRLSEGLIDLAKLRDIPVVFALHNLEYHNPETFRRVDYVIVPSQFARDHYWRSLGLDCQVLPNVIDPGRVASVDRRGEFLTFINPQPAKGLFVMARIAEQLASRRPDIPLLVVEGRAGANWRERLGDAASLVESVESMPYSSDPRTYYAVSKLVLMPSLWNETFGLVAAEGMINGIPVVASNRGALPETVGDAGVVLEIPERYTAKSALVPDAGEVEPWIAAICRLWDDSAYYEQVSRQARMRAEQWRPERLAPLYEGFFRQVAPQPGPPLAPRV